MTRCRLTYALLFAVMFFFHILLVDYISYFVVVFLLFLPGISLLIAVAFCRESTVAISVGPAMARIGDEAFVALKVTNLSFLPVRTRVEFTVRNELMGGEKREVLIFTRTTQSVCVVQSVSFAWPGRILCRIERTGVYDPLGIFCLKTKDRNLRSAGLLVLPDVIPAPGAAKGGPAARDVESDGLTPVVKGDDPSELYDIREYQPGDRVTRVHWKLSEKNDRMMVKELGRVIAEDTLITIDLNGGADEADALLTALASISASFAAAGASHDIEWYSARRRASIRDHVATEEDRERVVASILSESARTAGPFVLNGRLRSGGPSPYGKAICLCSRAGMEDMDLTALAAKMAASELSVVMVTRQGAPAETAAATGASPRVFRVDPSDIAATLREAIL
jgi:uncharacterized protein (DUF58 family)